MTNLTTGGIRGEKLSIEVGIETEGEPEHIAEKIHMAAHDAAARAIQAYESGRHPDKCEGIGITIDWDGAVEGKYGEVPADD